MYLKIKNKKKLILYLNIQEAEQTREVREQMRKGKGAWETN